MQKDMDLFRQNFGSAQRLLRQIGKEEAGHLTQFVKLLSVANSGVQSTRQERAQKSIDKLSSYEPKMFQPTLLIQWEPKILARFDL